MTQICQPFTYVDLPDTGDANMMQLAKGELKQLGANQVLIEVHCAGVNGPDIKQRQGAYPAPKDASPILGLEVAGTVIAIGSEVSQLQAGDRVCALVPGGGYASHVVTYAQHCLPIPQGMSMMQAAALPETFFTVWGNVFMRGKLQANEWLLVHGGAGGIGSTTIALAKAFGAKVIATASSAQKRDYCLQIGADHCVQVPGYGADAQTSLVDAVLSLTNGRGVDVVLDMAGGEMINQNLKMIASDGRIVSIAMQSGAKATVDVFRLMAKRVVWTGSTLRPQSVAAKAAIAAELKQTVWPLLDVGTIQLQVDRSFALSEVVAAHEYMESGEHKGKIVLQLK
ncbi:NAD(P)H-quinone oxidoreductase [Shewanella sp. WXL01]|uniref:NAD(P)H-quinone oxidoreductase n=1 Tax=Shewanella sp. WXL01 TaxID=2709721 RepID=UPI0014385A68|nr:NAD(P)H-quinone oxidoreductase [Shewanella sp. WXL01]NKF52314.1 NAD(P)H-quinone oxidoreductase [Shewanella sp. WXL01]